MRFERTILLLLILYTIVFTVNATILSYLKDTLKSKKNASESSLNIIIVKRDLASTIKKRSLPCDAKKCGGSRQLKPCSDEQLMVFLAEIQAINPESIVNLSTLDEIVVICREVSNSLDKMDEYLLTCRIVSNKNLYIQLIRGVDKLYSKLCTERSQFRKDFQKHLVCLKELHEDFETCFGPPDWIENTSNVEICKSYKDIANCYYIKAARVCGKEAAQIMKNLVKAVVDAIIPIPCAGIIFNPIVKDAFPLCRSSRNDASYLVLVMMVLQILLFYG